METEALVTCPYDESHRVSQRRLHIHIISCKKNHLNSTKVQCKFNSLHVYDRMEIDHHMATCSSSGHVRANEFVIASDKPVASIPLVVTDNHVYKNGNEEENWDNVDVKSYNPLHNLQSRLFFQMPVGLSKADKRKFKQMERERHRNIQNDSSSVNASCTIENNMNYDLPLRPPRHAAKACSIETAVNISNMQKQPDSKNKQSANFSKNDTAQDTNSSGVNAQLCEELTDALSQKLHVSFHSPQQGTIACSDQVASVNRKKQEQFVCAENESAGFNKNASTCTVNSSYDQTYKGADVKYRDHKETKLNEILDDIQLNLKNNLSLTSKYYNGYPNVKDECDKEIYADVYSGNTVSTSSDALDSINSRMAMLQEYEQKISEEKDKLLKQKMDILKTAESRTDRSFARGDITARMMGKYSTGRGIIRAHREYEQIINRKPGAGLQISSRQENTIATNQQNDDKDKFFDDYPNENTNESKDRSVKHDVSKSKKI